jgi:hypothetical protein
MLYAYNVIGPCYLDAMCALLKNHLSATTPNSQEIEATIFAISAVSEAVQGDIPSLWEYFQMLAVFPINTTLLRSISEQIFNPLPLLLNPRNFID